MHTVNIDSDERGFYLDIEGEIFYLADPEALYDQARSRIGPWLREREEAFQEFKRLAASGVFACDPDESAGAYELSDPKHESFHSVHADIWDARADK